MGNFQQKFDKFIEVFIEYNGYVKVLEGLKNTVIIAALGLIIGIIIGTLIATAGFLLLLWLVFWHVFALLII